MTRRILLNVDGATCAVDTDPRTPLLWILSWVLREPLALVPHLDGAPIHSWTPVSAAAGARIDTMRSAVARPGRNLNLHPSFGGN